MEDAGERDGESADDAGRDAQGGRGTGGESGAGGRSGEGGAQGDAGDGDTPDAAFGDAGDADAAVATGAACLTAGDQVTPTGAGACEAPFVIDMRALELGDSVMHAAGDAPTNGLLPSVGKCALGTGRDIVYNVQLPSAADLEVSVDAAEGADPSILVQEAPDTACDEAAATDCVDESAVGGCEYVRVRAGHGGYEANTPQVSIGELEHSGVPLIVRFRLIDPGGGS